MTGAQRVVVAVDAEDDGRTVDWAAAEAAARGCGLHVVRVEPLRWAADPSGLVPVADVWSCLDAADVLLRTAVRRARAVASDVEVSGEVLLGPAVPVLVAQGRSAQLLVLGGRPGSRGHGLLGRLSSPVCDRVAAAARCPVAVVGPLPAGPRSGAPPRVVVGVDGRGWCTAALGFAFRAAAQRGLPVTAVHAVPPDLPADHPEVTRAALDEALAPARRAYPDLPVEVRLAGTDPVAELVRESDGAALVVGSRGRGALRSALFGSVARSLLRQAHCPVVVVRPARPAHPAPARTDRRTGARPVRSESLHRWGGGWV